MTILRSLCLIVVIAASGGARGDWPQWGGPNRDFTLPAGSRALAPWTDDGPKIIWRREIGPGYSGVVVGARRAITMYREGDREVVAAFSTPRGKPLWTHSYAAPVPAGSHSLDTSYGEGPNSTPLLADGNVYTLGFTGIVQCVRAKNGRPRWSRDLAALGVSMPYFGHASSPIRFRDVVIVIAGGAHALDLETGESRWSNTSFEGSYASAILVERGGRKVLVVPAAGEVVGLDPENGKLLWRHEHANQYRTILSSPVDVGDGWIFVSAYFLGSIGLELSPDGSAVVERWESPHLQLSHTNAIAEGGRVVGFHKSIMTAVDARTGEILWRRRGVRRANLLKVGGSHLLLDDLGSLVLAKLDDEGVDVRAEAQLFEERAWTAPTFDRGLLLVRNRRHLMALDLTGKHGAVRTRSVLRGRSSVPPDFLDAIRRLQETIYSDEREELQAARATLGSWRDDEAAGARARYYEGLTLWRESILASDGEARDLVDRAVESLETATRAEPDFADAHAVLGTLYAMYYRLDPGRAAIVGPKADEHLEIAARLEPRNPRVLLLRGRRLFYRPERYGGDPDRGLALMRQSLERFPRSEENAPRTEPSWGHALAWYELGQALLRLGEPDSAGARDAFERALAKRPGFQAARRELANLP